MKSEWKTLKLGDISDITKLAGYEFTKHVNYIEDGEIIALRGLNVKSGKLILDEVKRISKETSDFLVRSKLLVNDILLTYTGTIGEVAIIEENDKYHLAPNVCRLRPDTNQIPEYIYQYMRSKQFYNQLDQFSVGSTQKTVPMKNIRLIDIVLPPLRIQKKIAHILSTLDDKIELNRKMNQTLEEMAQAIFKSWFVDFDPVHAKAKCSIEAELEAAAKELGISKEVLDLFPSEFEESELGIIPKGWEVKKLGDIDLEIESGKRPKGGIDKELKEGVPSVGAESIAPIGYFDSSNVKYVTAEFASNAKKGWVQDMDVALYKDGGKPGVFMPRVALYGNSFPFKSFMVNEHVFLLRSKELGQYVLYYLISSKSVLDQLIARGSAKAAQPGLNQTEVKDSKFIYPSSSIINMCNSILKSLVEKMLDNGKQIEALQKTRDTLLPKLLSGELDISELDIATDNPFELYFMQFGEYFDLNGLYWNDQDKQIEIVLDCLEKNKPLKEILTNEELQLIEDVKAGKVLL